jgi:hypothetical protein
MSFMARPVLAASSESHAIAFALVHIGKETELRPVVQTRQRHSSLNGGGIGSERR